MRRLHEIESSLAQGICETRMNKDEKRWSAKDVIINLFYYFVSFSIYIVGVASVNSTASLCWRLILKQYTTRSSSASFSKYDI